MPYSIMCLISLWSGDVISDMNVLSICKIAFYCSGFQVTLPGDGFYYFSIPTIHYHFTYLDTLSK